MLAACYTLVGVANVYILGISNFLTPRAAHAFAEGGVDALRRVLYKTGLLYAGAIGSFFLIMSLAGGVLLSLLFGSDYARWGQVVTLLSASVLIKSFGVTAGQGLWAIERPRANVTADCVILVVTMGAAVLLVLPYGVLGCALATFGGTAAGATVRCVTLLRLLRQIEEEPAQR